ncbi:MAG: hypothetical protein D6812_03480 [Deltaproteobacteria bacterium]|nr:MAG: hypothetical protein D6812_03480 [Deltaproteobacteria bacterium]
MGLDIVRKRCAVLIDRAAGEKIIEEIAAAGFTPLLHSFREHFFTQIGWKGSNEEKERLRSLVAPSEEGLSNGDLFLGEKANVLFLKIIDDGKLYRERLIGTPLDPGNTVPDAWVEIGEITAVEGDGTDGDLERFAEAVGKLLPEGSRWEPLHSLPLDLASLEDLFPVTSTHDLDIVTILDDPESRMLLDRLEEGEGVILEAFRAENDLDPERFQQKLDRMKAARLVAQECLILSRETGQPLTRLKQREDIALLDQAGVRSPQGRRLSEEDVQDFLSISEHGREILDGAYPMAPAVASALEALGIPSEQYHLHFDLAHDDVSFVVTYAGYRIVIQLSAGEMTRERAEKFAERLIGCDADRALLVSKVPVSDEIKAFLGHFALKSPPRYIESMTEIEPGLGKLLEEIRAETATTLLEEYTPLTTLNIAPVLLAMLKA